jgi:hypothetical protein
MEVSFAEKNIEPGGLCRLPTCRMPHRSASMHRAQKGKHDDYQNEVSCSKTWETSPNTLAFLSFLDVFLLLNPKKKESVTHHIKLLRPDLPPSHTPRTTHPSAQCHRKGSTHLGKLGPKSTSFVVVPSIRCHKNRRSPIFRHKSRIVGCPGCPILWLFNSFPWKITIFNR